MTYPTKYKPEYCELLLQTCEEGGFIAHFCVKVKITRPTFYEWKDTYPEFAEAVQLGELISESLLMDKATDGMLNTGFNSAVWSQVMRNKFGFTDQRKVGLDFTKCKTHEEKLEVIQERVRQGRLTTAEAKQWAEFVALGAKIEENTELRARLEALEVQNASK